MIPPSLQGTILLVQRNHSLCDFLSLLTNTQQKRQPQGLAFLRLSCKKLFFCARRGFSVQGEVFLCKERFFCLRKDFPCLSGNFLRLFFRGICWPAWPSDFFGCLMKKCLALLAEKNFRLPVGIIFSPDRGDGFSLSRGSRACPWGQARHNFGRIGQTGRHTPRKKARMAASSAATLP